MNSKSASSKASNDVSFALNRHLIFVHGKGGVGKTVVSNAIAVALAEKGLKTLWVTLEDPTRPAGELSEISPWLWHLNCDFYKSFEEYASLKIGTAPLTRLFLGNKLVRYMAKAAPGIHELVILGKIWFERLHYSHVVVDLPSTGYGLAMFQSTQNFIKLFQGGPLHRDAQAMLDTFQSPLATSHLILSLPEEMPLRESLELNHYLKQIFPENPAHFMVNRVFPSSVETKAPVQEHSSKHSGPLARSTEDYIHKRVSLEKHNLRIWKEENLDFGQLDYVPPPVTEAPQVIVQKISEQIQSKGYL